MAHKPHAFENQIFEHCRILERVKLIKEAIELLKNQGYTVIDLEGNILRKKLTDNEKIETKQ